MNDNGKSRPVRGAGYPLGLLFVWMAAVSVLLAMCGVALRTELAEGSKLIAIVGGCVGGAIVGSIFGAVMGLFHHRRVRGILLGALTGAFTLPLVVPILMVETASFFELMALSLFGSILILALAGAVRINSARQ